MVFVFSISPRRRTPKGSQLSKGYHLAFKNVFVDVEGTFRRWTLVKQVGLPNDLVEGFTQHQQNVILLFIEFTLHRYLLDLQCRLFTLQLLHGLFQLSHPPLFFLLPLRDLDAPYIGQLEINLNLGHSRLKS